MEVFDEWNDSKCDRTLDINAEGDTISFNTERNPANVNVPHGWMDAFGSLVIQAGDIHIWKIKQLHKYRSRLVLYGIIEESKASKDIHAFCADRHEAGYGFGNNGCVYDGINQGGSNYRTSLKSFQCDIVEFDALK